MAKTGKHRLQFFTALLLFEPKSHEETFKNHKKPMTITPLSRSGWDLVFNHGYSVGKTRVSIEAIDFGTGFFMSLTNKMTLIIPKICIKSSSSVLNVRLWRINYWKFICAYQIIHSTDKSRFGSTIILEQPRGKVQQTHSTSRNLIVSFSQPFCSQLRNECLRSEVHVHYELYLSLFRILRQLVMSTDRDQISLTKRNTATCTRTFQEFSFQFDEYIYSSHS